MIRRSGFGSAALVRRGGSGGQALAEFALVAPIFFLVLFGIIDFGRYVYYVQILNNAAREGARYAIVHGSNSLNPSGPPASGTTSSDPTGTKVVAVVQNFAVGVIGDTSVLTITPQWLAQPSCSSPGTNARENCVKVQVTYQFHSVIPVVPIPAIQITGESTLVINN
jgi:Flp pilus assembly protein TadG